MIGMVRMIMSGITVIFTNGLDGEQLFTLFTDSGFFSCGVPHFARLHNLRCNISVESFLSIYLVVYGNWSRRSWVNEAFSVSGRVGFLYLRSKGAQISPP